ncbi:hypothetical protein GCM10023149_24940 [Mucilaginibacter gynuensis]|uniref:Uncharacterized protein n=1 Tax=Mucilaginibacter gynuensis TaxID=1302236 RepID=A0ABP8GG51_9SPHI
MELMFILTHLVMLDCIVVIIICAARIKYPAVTSYSLKPKLNTVDYPFPLAEIVKEESGAFDIATTK